MISSLVMEERKVNVNQIEKINQNLGEMSGRTIRSLRVASDPTMSSAFDRWHNRKISDSVSPKPKGESYRLSCFRDRWDDNHPTVHANRWTWFLELKFGAPDSTRKILTFWWTRSQSLRSSKRTKKQKLRFGWVSADQFSPCSWKAESKRRAFFLPLFNMRPFTRK